MTFSTGQTQTVASSGRLSGNTAYNVACIYNGQSVCLYLNGGQQVSPQLSILANSNLIKPRVENVVQSCAAVSSVFAEGGILQIGSDGSNNFNGGFIDEVHLCPVTLFKRFKREAQLTVDSQVKFYDHALSTSELALINSAGAANDQPAVQIGSLIRTNSICTQTDDDDDVAWLQR